MDIEKILSELTLEEKAGLCSGDDYWHTKAVERLQVPRVMLCDGPAGLRKQTGEGKINGIGESIQAVCFPGACAMSCSFDRELLAELGETLGKECQAENVAMLLGPGINIKRSPLCGRNFEYYSEDPVVAGELARAYIKALQDAGISSCVKHFACNNQETRRMSSNSVLDERTLHEIYLTAFERAVKEGGADSVMCAYNAVNGTFCTENEELLSEILRKRWDYRGLTVTDWGAVKDRAAGLAAGLDLEMPGGKGAQDKLLVRAVQEGKLKESALEEAVRRILLFVDRALQNHKENIVFDREADHAKAVRFAAESAVLLKNEESVLPLKEDEKVAFIGEFAVNPRYQGGGSSHVNSYKVENAVGAAAHAIYAQGYELQQDGQDQEALLEEAVRAAKEADKAVIFAGLPERCESEGADRTGLEMPPEQIRLIEEVAKVQPDTVVVLHTGAPVEMKWLGQVKGVLNLYLAGEGAGRAAVELLYGNGNPSGKLAETWPLRIEDTPAYLDFPGERGTANYREGIFVGYRYYDKRKMEVLFPFGFGLSYTTFAYRDLRIEKESVTDSDKVKVSCKVKNTGARRGKEAVQFYVKNPAGEVNRPVRELRDFVKVELEPGEEKEVSVVLDGRAFSYYEPKIHDWYIEAGVYEIEAAASSRDIRLSGKISAVPSKKLPVHFSRYSTVAELLETETGKRLMEDLIRNRNGNENKVEHLGEGSRERAQKGVGGMPLSSLVTFGKMTAEELDGLIERLNGHGGADGSEGEYEAWKESALKRRL